jgi:Co/Zn/Cd efflux system component
MTSVAIDPNLRRVVRFLAVLNLTYFGIEFAVARVIRSVSLLADSIDFLEEASVTRMRGTRKREREAAPVTLC